MKKLLIALILLTITENGYAGEKCSTNWINAWAYIGDTDEACKIEGCELEKVGSDKDYVLVRCHTDSEIQGRCKNDQMLIIPKSDWNQLCYDEREHKANKAARDEINEMRRQAARRLLK